MRRKWSDKKIDPWERNIKSAIWQQWSFYFLCRYEIPSDNPVWAFVWDLIRPLMWEGYVINPNDPRLLRTTHLNKMLTKISKLSASVQVSIMVLKKTVWVDFSLEFSSCLCQILRTKWLLWGVLFIVPCWTFFLNIVKEILNSYQEDSVADGSISVQATEIAADIAVNEYMQTMTALNIDPGFVYDQVRET